MRSMQDQARNPLRAALRQSRGTFAAVALFSAVVNVLGLTGSFYMLQVYDRVLSSRSVETLVAISLLALGLFVLQGLLDVLRAQVMNRIGTRVGELLARATETGQTPWRVAVDRAHERLSHARDI